MQSKIKNRVGNGFKPFPTSLIIYIKRGKADKKETFAHSSILLLFCGEVVFLYVEPKTKVKESVNLYVQRS